MKNSIFEKYNIILSQTPNRVIAVKGDREYTIKEIDVYSNVIAGKVKAEFADLRYVPVYSKDDLFYLICMIGIWKANKIYVPIQINFPQKRFEYILDTLGVKKVLSQIDDETVCGEQIRIDVAQFDDVEVNKNPIQYPKGEDCAYLLMTSGSTGTPKCVCVKHENLNWLLNTMQQLIDFSIQDRFLVSTPVSFDVSFHEILSWIYGEGKIIFIEGVNGVDKFKKIKDVLFEKHITHIAMSPSAFNSVAKLINTSFENMKLKHIILAGEELLPSVISSYISNTNIHFYNFYGPTETTIYATGYEVKKICGNRIPIGKPLPGANVILLDNNLEVVADYGEIAISGNGLSMGYLNDTELNSQKIKSINGVNYYLTGDFAFCENGEYIFDCRKDEQIELNGMRIELGEIDAAIYNIKRINCSKTIYVDRKIVTFIEKGAIDSLYNLKLELQEYLPDYMLPHKCVEINEIPLNSNRKTDIKKLEDIYHERYAFAYNQEKQECEENKYIGKSEYLELYSKILEMNISENTDLIIECGIDSLQQIEIIVSLEEMFNVEISYNIIQTYRTPRAIWKELTNKKTVEVDLNIAEYIQDNISTHLGRLKSEAHCLYDTYYIQKCYRVDNFSQVLSESVRIPIDIPKEILEEQLEKYVTNNNLLSAYMLGDEPVKFAIPTRYTADLREYISNLDECIIEKVIDFLNNEYRDLMFYCFINNDGNGRYLNIFINHNVCDQSSLNILVEELNDLFWRKEIKKKSTSYFDFITYQNENIKEGSGEKLENIYKMGFEKVDEADLQSGPAMGYIKYKCNDKNKKNIIMDMNYRVMQILMESQNLSIISAGTLFDMRRFKDLDITDVIGDVHTTLPLLSKRGESMEVFLNRNEQIYSMAYEGFNWNNALYKDYPFVMQEFKKYEHYIDDNQKISTNFIGRIKGDSIEEIVNSIKAKNIVLKRFSLSKLYVTSFMYNEDMVCVFLNDALISKDAVNKYNCEVVY